MLTDTPQKNLAIIPARGGSKGIPGKNLRPLVGQPLVAHTIEQAHQAHQVGRVIVSTDDPRIAAVSEQYGAEVIWRPAEISGDTASSESALLHALDFLKQSEGYVPELLVFLQCTSPLTLAEDIDGTIRALLNESADSALTVTPFHYFLWRHNENGDAVGINHDKRVRLLRQQREPEFIETGAVYVMRVEGFQKAKHRFFGKTAMYVMPPERRLEIDEPVDLQIAEVMMRERQKNQRIETFFSAISLLVLDFDGVMTDNRVFVNQNGAETVLCDRSDGWGIARLKEAGVDVIVLSTETNSVVSARCQKLGVPCIQGSNHKLVKLQELVQQRSLTPEQVAYVGNDVNDLECMQWVGMPIAVANAVPEVRSMSCLVTTQRGGEGAVREICDLILTQRNGGSYG
jgi:N-acylneuraminate cytidylyltransferase